MIAWIKGKVIKKSEKAVFLMRSDIAYVIHVPKNSISNIELDSTKELWIHSHIREDAFDLYGFEKYEELEFFKTLISINGIGPKAGLEIVSSSIEKIKEAILNEDIAYICRTPGIGQKTAKRMILELKGKIVNDSKRVHKDLGKQVNEEIVDALSNLGFQKNQIIKTLSKLPADVQKEEEIISYFLKNN